MTIPGMMVAWTIECNTLHIYIKWLDGEMDEGRMNE